MALPERSSPSSPLEKRHPGLALAPPSVPSLGWAIGWDLAGLRGSRGWGQPGDVYLKLLCAYNWHNWSCLQGRTRVLVSVTFRLKQIKCPLQSRLNKGHRLLVSAVGVGALRREGQEEPSLFALVPGP